jgi:hypothetical protein
MFLKNINNIKDRIQTNTNSKNQATIYLQLILKKAAALLRKKNYIEKFSNKFNFIIPDI